MDERIPDLLLEKAALDELTPAEARALDERLAGAPEGALAAQLQALRDDDAAILAAHPPARAAAVIERRLADARARRRSPLWIAGPMIVATAAIALWVRLGDEGVAGPIDAPVATTAAGLDDAGPEGVRLKGLEPHLELHRRGGAGAERLDEGARVAAGDVLQVSYVAAGRRRGLVLSIDGRGLVTLHYPEREGGPIELKQDGAIPLTHSYELDDAPAFERFVFVTAEGPAARIDVDAVVAAAQAVARGSAARSAPLALGPGLGQRSFVVEKSGGGR
ncbi:MAG: hypothetical protein R3B09_10945 [Nannocystaceae bacterium]